MAGGRIEARETAARRTPGPQRREAPDTTGGARFPHGIKPLVLRACGVAGDPPSGKTFCLSRQVVERGGQCGEALAKPRGVDRVVGRGLTLGRRRERMRLCNAGKQNARGGVCGDSAAGALRQARRRRGGSNNGRQTLRGRAARMAAVRRAAAAGASSAEDITTAMPKRRRSGSGAVRLVSRFRGGGRVTTRSARLPPAPRSLPSRLPDRGAASLPARPYRRSVRPPARGGSRS